ncbi:NosD domain-containing protein [Bacteroidota bacterium]
MKTKLFIIVLIVYATVNISFADTINIPGDFSSIQEGIDAANPGDTVFVESGIYYENLLIEKTIALVGQDSSNTIIDGSFNGDVITVWAKNVEVVNFTVKNSGGELDMSGIKIIDSDGCFINKCYLTGNNYGYTLLASCYNVIKNSRIEKNQNGIVYNLYWGEDTLISRWNRYNSIINNSIQNNSNVGILYDHADRHMQNDIRKNIISKNKIGISIITTLACEISYNEISNNSGHGVITEICDGGGGQNVFHHNVFLSNNNDSGHVKSYVWNEYWFFNGEGNYWDDYTGSDMNGDGIGEEPYYIRIWNKDTLIDAYPLTEIGYGPILTWPYNKSISQRVGMTLQWEEVEGAQGYIIQIARDRFFSDDSMVYSGLSNLDNNHSITLEYAAKYYWRVRVAGDENADNWSYVWNFTTGISAPVLIAPLDGASGLDTIVAFEWQPYENAEQYIIEISKNNSFSWVVYRDILDSVTKINCDKFEYNSRYYWRVRVAGDEYTDNWSDVWSFTTKTESGININGISGILSVEIFPNPFEDNVSINYSLQRKSNISIKIYDILGRQVCNLFEGYQTQGEYSVKWIPDNLPRGVYFYVFEVDSMKQSGMLIYRK